MSLQLPKPYKYKGLGGFEVEILLVPLKHKAGALFLIVFLLVPLKHKAGFPERVS